MTDADWGVMREPVTEVSKKMGVILLGPDCGGKSTLARSLGEYYDVPITPNVRIKDPLKAMHAVLDFAINKMPKDTGKGFVLDQWNFPVDLVYRSVIDGAISPLFSLVTYLAPYLVEHKILFLHITASAEVLTKRFEARGDDLWNIEQILRIAVAYPKHLERLPLHIRTIDTSDLSPVNTLARAVQIIDHFYEEDIT
jgi:hypothetical protein